MDNVMFPNFAFAHFPLFFLLSLAPTAPRNPNRSHHRWSSELDLRSMASSRDVQDVISKLSSDKAKTRDVCFSETLNLSLYSL